MYLFYSIHGDLTKSYFMVKHPPKSQRNLCVALKQDRGYRGRCTPHGTAAVPKSPKLEIFPA